MKFPLKVSIVVGIGVLVAVVAYFARLPREPEYEGKRLREWLEDVDSREPKTREAAHAALREMGAASVPFLIELLGERSSFPSRLPRVRWTRGGTTYNVNLTPASRQTKRAIIACYVLKQQAKPAIPALALVLSNGDFPHDAAAALGKMGPDALPALTNAFASPVADARKEAVTIFQRVPYDAQAAIPALVARLKDADANVRIQATQSLAIIGKQPEVVVPALMQSLADSNLQVRFFAINALRRFGPDARRAVPLLLNAAKDTSPQISGAAAQAIKSIAPQAEGARQDP